MRSTEAPDAAPDAVPTPPRRGLLLVNLGTPDAPDPRAVRRYLAEFLMDRRVVDLPAPWRWLLVHGVILRSRPKVSSHAYRKIWTERGSPLMVHGRALAGQVAQRLGGEFEVELAMRYGSPSLASALGRLRSRGVDRLTVLPLYPQSAASSSGSTAARLYQLLEREWDAPPVDVLPAFFDDPGYLDAYAAVAGEALARAPADHVLFSFHGVPERHVRRSDATGVQCLGSPSCSDALTPANRSCYRAQCLFTARELARRVGLSGGGFTVSFQSRLGRTKWIEPYTDATLSALARRGVKRLAVVCPSFVADCLETLEEIGIRGRDQFLREGGEAFTLVPCLNADPRWVDAVVRLARREEVRGP